MRLKKNRVERALELRTIQARSSNGNVYACEAILHPVTQDRELPDGNREVAIEFTRLNDWRRVQPKRPSELN